MMLGKGAEATVVRQGGYVIKTRAAKKYRHSEIDYQLRQFRTRREAKVLEKLKAISFPSPRLQKIDDTAMEIKMDFIDGDLVKNILAHHPAELSREIGRKVGILHANNIIHGDLTTSNMIFTDKIYFIDFGLSFFSQKLEDKAVDLHLLRCALESKHWEIFHKCFQAVLEGYKETNSLYQPVFSRMEEVEARGRNKHK